MCVVPIDTDGRVVKPKSDNARDSHCFEILDGAVDRTETIPSQLSVYASVVIDLNGPTSASAFFSFDVSWTTPSALSS